MNTFEVSSLPELFGSDASEADALWGAIRIAAQLRERFPDLKVVVVERAANNNHDDPRVAEAQDSLETHWLDWI